MLDIYRHYVLHTVITFDYDVPTLEEFHEKIAVIQQNHPCLVLLLDDTVIGYAYGNEFRHKAAYQWAAESTIYLSKDTTGKGLGPILYQTLFDLLRAQGFYKAYAGVTLPNAKSEKLHLSCGFEELVVYRDVGYKAGAWHDTVWYELALAPLAQVPHPPKGLAESEEAFRIILERVNGDLAKRQSMNQ